MQAQFEHAGEDLLERYSMGTLPEAEREILEEHLLCCPACQDLLTEVDAYVRVMRAAASKLRKEGAGGWLTWFRNLPVFFSVPNVAWAAAAAFGLVLLIWVSGFRQSPRPTSLPPVAVILQAERGADGAAGVQAPSNHPLLLQADLAGLLLNGGGELEVVDARGRQLQRAQATQRAGRLEAQVSRGLAAGQYWVRLYASGSGDEPLREYSLRVE